MEYLLTLNMPAQEKKSTPPFRGKWQIEMGRDCIDEKELHKYCTSVRLILKKKNSKPLQRIKVFRLF